MSEQLELAREAIEAHGNTELTIAWYRKWKPDYFARSGIPTTAQYSLSCFLMQHAAALLRAEKGPVPITPEGRATQEMFDRRIRGQHYPWCSGVDCTCLG